MTVENHKPVLYLMAVMALTFPGAAAAQRCPGVQLLVDSDGDGIDDALECRLGIDRDETDSDLDGTSDFEELVYGTDPRKANSVAVPLNLRPRVIANIYVLNNDVVLSCSVLYQSQYEHLRLYYADRDRIVGMGGSVLQFSRVSSATVAASEPGWFIDTSKYLFHRIPFEKDVSSIAFVAEVDSQDTVSRPIVLYHDHGITKNTWMEWTRVERTSRQWMSNGKGQVSGAVDTGKGSTVDPNGVPENHTEGQACSQSVSAVGFYPDGRAIWEVTAAECVEVDQEPPAICPSDCKSAVGEEFVTIDVVGLLGG